MKSNYYDDSFTPEQTNWIQSQRRRNPSYKYVDDSTLYRILRDEDNVPQEFYNETIDQQRGFRTPKTQDDVEKMRGLALLTDTIGDLLPDYELLRTAYERSLTGQTRKMLYGESKFLDTYDTSPQEETTWYNDVLASAVSFSMPLDALTMSVGARFGGGVARGRWFKQAGKTRVPGVETFMRNNINKKVAQDGYRGLTLGQNMGLGAVEGAFPLAFYEGAMGYVGAKINNQNPNNENIDPVSATVKGVIHGGVLGALTGGVSAGLMSKKAMQMHNVGGRKLTSDEFKKLSLKDRNAWRLATAPGMIAVESGIFTTAETIEKIYNGEDVRLFGENGILRSFAKNAALFGTLKLKKKAFGDPYGTLSAIMPNKIRSYAKSKMKNIHDDVLNEFEAKTRNEVSRKKDEIVKDLQKEIRGQEELVEEVVELAKGVRKNMEYVQDSYARGKNHFEKDAQGLVLLNNMHLEIANIRDKIKKLNSSENILEARQAEESLSRSEKDFADINKILGDKFKEFIDKGDSRNELLSDFALRNITQLPFQGKPTSIYDIPTAELQKLAQKRKDISLQKENIESQSRLDRLDKKLDLADTNSWLRGIGKETGTVIVSQPILVRRKQLAPLLKSKAPASIKGTKAENKYLESTKVIDYLIQTHYPEFVPSKGATRIKINTAKTQVRHLKEFSEYLAKKGKTFENATSENIRTYLQEPGTKRGSHDSAINRLIITMNKLKIGTKSLRQTDDKQVKSWTKKIIEDVEVEAGKGLRPEQFDVKKNIIQKPTSKKGVFKEVPISIRTSQLSKKNEKKYKIPANEGSFRNVDGKEIYGNQALHGLYEKIVKPLNQKKVQPARQIRDMMKDFFAGQKIKDKQSGVEIEINKFVNDVAMGQNTLKQLDSMYGIKKGRAQAIYKEILKKFNTAINGHITGKKPLSKKMFDIKEEGRFSFYEVIDGLKNIVNGKGFKNNEITFEERSWDSKLQKRVNTGVKHTVSKDMAEFMFRSMLEVPSRLNEVIREAPKAAEISALETNLLDQKQIQQIEKNILKAEKITPLQATQKAIEAAKKLQEIKIAEEKFKKSGEYAERLRINRQDIKPLEKELKSLSKKQYEGISRDIRLEVFGLENLSLKKNKLSYEIKNETGGATSEKLEYYKEKLESVINNIKQPTQIQKELRDKGFTDKQIKEIAIAIGQKNGDISKLDARAAKRIRSLIKDFNLNNVPEIENVDFREESTQKSSAALRALTGLKRYYMGTLYRISEMAYAEKNPTLKKELRTVEEKLDKLSVYNELFKGSGTTYYNKYMKPLPKNLRKETYWMSKKHMKEIIDVVEGRKKVTEQEKAKYKEIYDRNIEPYKKAYEKGGEGTPENIAAVGMRQYLDLVYNKFKDYVLDAPQHKVLKIKNPEKYKELVEQIDNLREKDYIPQYVRKNILSELDRFVNYEKLHQKLLNKKLKEWSEKETDLKIKVKDAKTLRDKINKSEQYKELYERNLKRIKERKTKKLEEEYYNLDLQVEVGVKRENTTYDTNVESSNLRERTNKLPLIMTTKDGKVLETMRTKADEVFGTYILSSAKFNTIAKNAPEYLRNFYKGEGSGELQQSIKVLERNLRGQKQKKDFDYINNVVNEVIGVKGTKTFQGLSRLSNFVSVAGLSGAIEPGMKNFFLGQAMIIATHGTKDYVRAIGNLASREKWSKARENAIKKGAIDYVTKEFGTGNPVGAAKSLTEKVYQFSGMTRAENINRIVAIETSKLSAERYMGILSDKTDFYSQADKNEAARFLKDALRLRQEEIQKIENGDIYKKENIKEYNFIMDKVEIWGHKSTQGGVDVLDLPKWMNFINTEVGGIRTGPFFTFQRIATSVTGNLVRNVVKPAILHGNFAPLLRYTSSSYLSGAAQYAIKDELYKLEDPESLGSDLDKVMLSLWKAEYAGMFSAGLDLINPILYKKAGITYGPYFDTRFGGAFNSLTPPIVDLIANSYKSLVSGIEVATQKNGKLAGLYEVVSDLGKSNIVLLSQFDKLYKTRNKNYVLFKDVQNYVKQYEIDKGTYETPMNRGPYIRNIYYKKLKNELLLGNYEDIVRNYWAAYDYVYDDLLTKDPMMTKEKRIKEAHTRIKQSINSMNPLNMSEQIKGRYLSKKDEVLRYVLKNGGSKARQRALKAERIYQTKYNLIENIFDKKIKMKKYSSLSDIYMD